MPEHFHFETAVNLDSLTNINTDSQDLLCHIPNEANPSPCGVRLRRNKGYLSRSQMQLLGGILQASLSTKKILNMYF